MAKTKKTGGETAKSSGSNTPLLLGLLAVGALFVLKGNSASAATGPTNSGAGYNNDPLTPGTLPITLPPAVTSHPTSTPTSPPASPPPTPTPKPPEPKTPVFDNWGVLHRSSSTVDAANAYDDAQGLLYKAIADSYGFYQEDIDALLAFDHVQGGASFVDIYAFYQGDLTRFARLVQLYNQAHPQAIILPWGGTNSSTTPAAVASAQRRFPDRFGIPHRAQSSVAQPSGWADRDGQVWKLLSTSYHLFFEDVEALLTYEVKRSGNSWDLVTDWYRQDNSRFTGLLVNYNQANPLTSIVPRW